jgi:hypothetical protein
VDANAGRAESDGYLSQENNTSTIKKSFTPKGIAHIGKVSNLS